MTALAMEAHVESGLQTSKPPKSSLMSSIQRSPNYPEYSLFEKEVTIFGSLALDVGHSTQWREGLPGPLLLRSGSSYKMSV